MNAKLVAAVVSIGTAIAALITAQGDNALSASVRTAFAGGAPLLIAVLTFCIHATEQANVKAAGTVGAAKATGTTPAAPAAAAATPSFDITSILSELGPAVLSIISNPEVLKAIAAEIPAAPVVVAPAVAAPAAVPAPPEVPAPPAVS
jgi:hypothetical protein